MVPQGAHHSPRYCTHADLQNRTIGNNFGDVTTDRRAHLVDGLLGNLQDRTPASHGKSNPFLRNALAGESVGRRLVYLRYDDARRLHEIVGIKVYRAIT